MQKFIVFLLIFTAVSFIFYKLYKQFFAKKSSCESCSFSQLNEPKIKNDSEIIDINSSL